MGKVEAQNNLPILSVIVPVWREARSVLGALRWPDRIRELTEVVVSAAGNTASWEAAADREGFRFVANGRASRGGQMNCGAAVSRGEWLLFHHADGFLSERHIDSLIDAIRGKEPSSGAFYRHFDERHPRLRWLEPVERWHNRHFGAVYGDQSFFVRHSVFDFLGGFPDIPLMEDIAFSRKLRRAGGFLMIDPPMSSSPRRHMEYGPWRTTLVNFFLIGLYRMGVPPERLYAWYYQFGRTRVPKADTSFLELRP